MFLRLYPGLLWFPGDTVLTRFVLKFLLRTFMTARNHKQLCYVEIGFYINRLLIVLCLTSPRSRNHVFEVISRATVVLWRYCVDKICFEISFEDLHDGAKS